MEKISLALGGSVEPFWAVYTQHQAPMVADILRDLRIGTLHPDDVKAQVNGSRGVTQSSSLRSRLASRVSRSHCVTSTSPLKPEP